jgi:hypothetical protein
VNQISSAEQDHDAHHVAHHHAREAQPRRLGLEDRVVGRRVDAALGEPVVEVHVPAADQHDRERAANETGQERHPRQR